MIYIAEETKELEAELWETKDRYAALETKANKDAKRLADIASITYSSIPGTYPATDSDSGPVESPTTASAPLDSDGEIEDLMIPSPRIMDSDSDEMFDDSVSRASSQTLDSSPNMSGKQDNTQGNTSGYEISAVISDPAGAVAMYNKVVEETGCTTVIAKYIPVPDDQGVEQSETGTVSVGTANSNVSVEKPSAENRSSAEKK